MISRLSNARLCPVSWRSSIDFLTCTKKHGNDNEVGYGVLYRGFRPLCHLNWAKVRTQATASEFASYNLCEDADISAQKYTLAYTLHTRMLLLTRLL